MTVAFVSIGSNIEPEKNVYRAIKKLGGRLRILGISTVYLTKPLGTGAGPKFYNCVIKVDTKLSPYDLKFKILRRIERDLGRVRSRNKFAPRTIDLDLIMYATVRTKQARMVLPDPEIKKRPFLAIPLYELDHELVLPGAKPIRMASIAKGLDGNDMVGLKKYTKKLKSMAKVKQEKMVDF